MQKYYVFSKDKVKTIMTKSVAICNTFIFLIFHIEYCLLAKVRPGDVHGKVHIIIETITPNLLKIIIFICYLRVIRKVRSL